MGSSHYNARDQVETRHARARPSEPIPVPIIKRRLPFSRRAQRNVCNHKTRPVHAAVAIMEYLAKPAETINPTGEPVVRTTQQTQAIFYCPEKLAVGLKAFAAPFNETA